MLLDAKGRSYRDLETSCCLKHNQLRAKLAELSAKSSYPVNVIGKDKILSFRKDMHIQRILRNINTNKTLRLSHVCSSNSLPCKYGL